MGLFFCGSYLAIRTIILSGSRAIVNTNNAHGGPNAMKVQPKNSINVILTSLYFPTIYKF